MLFNSATYLAFLPLVVIVNWRLPKGWRPTFLLAASYLFYASWSAPYLLLIVGLTMVNYLIGLRQGHQEPRSRVLGIVAVALNLGALMVFKYLGLLDETARSLAGLLGLQADIPLVRLILPIGLSFFTFEFIHYQVDLLRGSRPVASLIHFALFPAFFPTQIAGPIKRYQDFERQVMARPSFDPHMALEGIELIAAGLFKKVVLADTLAVTADAVFRSPGSTGMIEAWAGLIAFSFQIYLDFSGYTDIGRGSAQLLGYRVPENFRAPYLAVTFREFWRRWHMSLSSWLRDYLYIPLGGSRGTLMRTGANLVITMTLGGLWHGAAWHFLLWGFGHGAVQSVERSSKGDAPRGAVRILRSWAVTQVLVVLLWALFRAPLDTALTLYSRLLVAPLTTGVVAVGPVLAIAVGVLAYELAPAAWRPLAWARTARWPFLARPGYTILLGSSVAYWAAVAGGGRSFIYFQF